MPTISVPSAAALLALTAAAAPAHAADFLLTADPSDFELRRAYTFDPDPAPPLGPVTLQSLDAPTVDVWIDGLSTYRVIEEFDLSPLLAAGDAVTSATLAMERVFAIYPNGSVRVNGLTTNRGTLLSAGGPAAIAAWDTPDAQLLDAAFAPNGAPNPATETFTLDVTAFLQARLDDAHATPAQALIAFRLDPQAGGTDIRFTAANAVSGFVPQLRVTVVPEPATASLVTLGAALLLRRRR